MLKAFEIQMLGVSVSLLEAKQTLLKARSYDAVPAGNPDTRPALSHARQPSSNQPVFLLSTQPVRLPTLKLSHIMPHHCLEIICLCKNLVLPVRTVTPLCDLPDHRQLIFIP